MLTILTTDLLFASRFHAVAREAAVETQTALTAEQAAAAAATGQLQALFLDLELPSLDLPELLVRMRAHGVPVVAYGPHVQHGKLDAARQAGCQRVLSRGEFDRGLPQLLAEYSAR